MERATTILAQQLAESRRGCVADGGQHLLPIARARRRKGDGDGDGDVDADVDVVAVADALHRLRIQFKFQVFGSVSTESQPH